jgi:archaellum component FlaF (FlaF/FlaG flagellin family)
MKKGLLFICCIGLFPFAKAQDAGSKTKEVIIEKKVSKPSKSNSDSSTNVTVTINGDTTEQISVVVDGEKITINGEEVKVTDPRLKRIRRMDIKGKGKIESPFDPKNRKHDNALFFKGDELKLEEFNKGFKFSFPDLPNMDQLMTSADKKPKLGISVQDLETGKGIKVTDVAQDSPAAKAGIQKEDVLMSLNGAEITDVNFMRWQYYTPGQVLKITLERKGEKRNIEVKIPKKINTADL